MLKLSRSQFYAWVQRGRESVRASLDRRLSVLIRSIHGDWNDILGYRRTHQCWRQDHGETVGIRRVRRLMKQLELTGIPKPRSRYRPRRKSRADANIPDLLNRDFSSSQPNRVWVTDLTEFNTGEGKLYLCVIKDVCDGALAATTEPTASAA